VKLTKVNRGQPLLPEMRADTWNAFIDAAIANRLQAGGKPLDRQQPRHSQSLSVLVWNNSGSDRDRGHILGIDGLMVTPDDDQNAFRNRPILEGVTPTSAHHGKFVVCEEVIYSDNVGWGNLAGLAVVKLDDLSKPWKLADVDTTDPTRLALTPNGTAQVLWSVTAGNESGNLTDWDGNHIVTQGGDNLTDSESYSWAMVRLGVPQAITYAGMADGNISVDSSGTISLYDDGSDTGENVTAYLDWMHGDEQVSSGKEVLVTWFPMESKWRITAAECED
jgi:hypothetical protein